jgi:hypothetical protein
MPERMKVYIIDARLPKKLFETVLAKPGLYIPAVSRQNIVLITSAFF